jgi:uncharacterized damage-inducible protein DinB
MRAMKIAGRVADLLASLEGAFEKRGWQGPTVLRSIRGVKGVEARKKPGHHSIHELVEHIAYWEEVGLSYIKKVPRPERRDWSRPTRSFAASVEHLRATHERLAAAVRLLSDQDLDRRVETGEGRMPLSRALHGVAAHAAYHAGQIGLIRSL